VTVFDSVLLMMIISFQFLFSFLLFYCSVGCISLEAF